MNATVKDTNIETAGPADRNAVVVTHDSEWGIIRVEWRGLELGVNIHYEHRPSPQGPYMDPLVDRDEAARAPRFRVSVFNETSARMNLVFDAADLLKIRGACPVARYSAKTVMQFAAAFAPVFAQLAQVHKLREQAASGVYCDRCGRHCHASLCDECCVPEDRALREAARVAVAQRAKAREVTAMQASNEADEAVYNATHAESRARDAILAAAKRCGGRDLAEVGAEIARLTHEWLECEKRLLDARTVAVDAGKAWERARDGVKEARQELVEAIRNGEDLQRFIDAK